MKNIALFIIIALVVGSCSLFDKPSMNKEQIAGMVERNAKLQEELVDAQHELSLAKMQAEECARNLAAMQTPKEAVVSGKYHVIVGSFKSPALAEAFSKKTKETGGTGTIVSGPSNFSLVAYNSFGTLRESVTAMEKARMNGSSDAWVYKEK